VEQDGGPNLFDRELDPPYRPPVLLSDEVSRYQRVVINPFLGVLGWVLVLFLLRRATTTGNISLLLVAMAWLFVPFFLLQYHCLVCGATGWHRNLSSHACAGVAARRRLQAARPRVSSPELQIRIWFCILVLAALIYVILIR
jgi:hypothetical protein